MDNAKHLYFSDATYPPADTGETRYEWSMSATGVKTNRDDIYDGFIAFHLLDAASGIAADFFASDDGLAIAYSRPQDNWGPQPSLDSRYLVIFKELAIPTSVGETHRYMIAYNRDHDEFSWIVDEKVVAAERNVPLKIGSFRLSLGIMTAKNIENGKSVSIHGQGMIGHWSPIRISRSD